MKRFLLGFLGLCLCVGYAEGTADSSHPVSVQVRAIAHSDTIAPHDPGDDPLPMRSLCGILGWAMCMLLAEYLGVLTRWGNIVAYIGLGLLAWGILYETER